MTDNDMQIVFLDMLEGDGEELTREDLEERIERIIDNLRYAIMDTADDYGIEEYDAMI